MTLQYTTKYKNYRKDDKMWVWAKKTTPDKIGNQMP